MKTIFTITAMNKSGKNQRVCGWHSSFEEAEKSVLSNNGDIFDDGYYDFAVIEEFEEGIIWAGSKQEHWYHAEETDQKDEYGSVILKISKINKPEMYSGIVCFSMG